MSGADFSTQAFTPFFDFQPGVAQDDRVTRWGLEAEYLYGPFSAKSEYLSGHFEKVGTGSRFSDLDVDGFYVNLGYVLTGEDAPIKPRIVFDPAEGGWGAWQLVGRYQTLRTDRGILYLGLARGTDETESITIGLNWHPNRHIRFQFNFDHAWFDEDILIQGVKLDGEDTFITRFLYDF